MFRISLFICIIFVTHLCTGPLIGQAASRFISGFNGAAWGTPKTELPDFGISDKMFNNIYPQGPSAILFMEGVGKLPLQFENVPLIAIYLRFENARLNGCDFLFSPDYHEQIRLLIERDMGAPGNTCAESTCWEEGNLSVTLTNRELMVVHLDK
ncbi:hypothetical protein [Desulfofustis limnaeus]|uniref:Uncharacterized protein n=1 Tax=Desulfofustis limnaeus TaxID=2740163 RepID=A0ABN6M6X2_9BACT|nr:hypothetical protein [Desulfofustis limnaeus]BDD88631.1 hypothetical protein DPPLL_29960 [Desulfofustis limnaeus]